MQEHREGPEGDVGMRHTPKRDPKPKRNGGCASCGKARPEVAVKHDDPFCSASCARDWHRVEKKS